MLPLVAKELVEQAAKPRTQILRVVSGAILLLVFALSSLAKLRQGGTDALLGHGGDLFQMLVLVQSIALVVMMPAMMAGAVAAEKENGTLQLLLMTRLGPWDLLFQKLISRCLAAGSVVLVGLPLLGIAYAYGGVDPMTLLFGIETLVTSLLFGASFGLLASTWSRTTAGAVVLGYGLILGLIGFVFSGGIMQWSWVPDIAQGVFPKTSSGESATLGLLLPPLVFLIRFFVPSTPVLDFSNLLLVSIMGLLPSLAALIAARLLFRRRADLTGQPLVKRIFRKLDQLAEDGDAALGQTRPKPSLPGDDPVVWLALRGRSLASWRYLVRFILPAIALLMVLMVPAAGLDSDSAIRWMIALWSLTLAVVVLFLVVIGSGLFAAERLHQTLEVLLTTPLTTRELLLGKARALRRIHLVGLVPLAVLAWAIWFIHPGGYGGWQSLPAMIDIVLLPALAGWTSVAIGLRVQQRGRALAMSLGLILVWWVGGLLVLLAVNDGTQFLPTRWWSGDRSYGGVIILSLFASPLVHVWANASGWLSSSLSLVESVYSLATQVLLYGGLTWLIRQRCVARVDHFLRQS